MLTIFLFFRKIYQDFCAHVDGDTLNSLVSILEKFGLQYENSEVQLFQTKQCVTLN